jgi:D-alanyl-D-alanine carboxypeptidase (penicillin-binding protein 5/6)
VIKATETISIFSIRCIRQSARLAVVTLIGFITACGESTQTKATLAALQEREEKVAAREEAASQGELQLAEQQQKAAQQNIEQQRALELARNDLQAQRKELEDLKAQLSEELTKARLLRESLATSVRRGPVPVVTADRVYVFDPRTDEVLFEKNADKRGQVASTQKLLTANLIISEGNLDQMVTIESADTAAAPVKFGLKVGEQYSRRQLLTALMVHSYNDIAEALARDNAGSLDAFVAKMNERAAQLGMKDSRFANPHGLPNDTQYSTARDMAKIAQADDALPELSQIVATKKFIFQKNDGKTVTLDNTNRVLLQDPRCDGMKTGYTQAAGYCLICSGEKDGRRRICVVLNDSHLGVWKDAQALLTWSLKG